MFIAVERFSLRGPGFDPRSGQVSWVRFFQGFSSRVRQMSGSAHQVPEYHLAIIIILIISVLLE